MANNNSNFPMIKQTIADLLDNTNLSTAEKHNLFHQFNYNSAKIEAVNKLYSMGKRTLNECTEAIIRYTYIAPNDKKLAEAMSSMKLTSYAMRLNRKAIKKLTAQNLEIFNYVKAKQIHKNPLADCKIVRKHITPAEIGDILGLPEMKGVNGIHNELGPIVPLNVLPKDAPKTSFKAPEEQPKVPVKPSPEACKAMAKHQEEKRIYVHFNRKQVFELLKRLTDGVKAEPRFTGLVLDFPEDAVVKK